MKTGIWSYYLNQLSITEMIDVFLAHGFTAAELADEHGALLLKQGDPIKTGLSLKEYADKKGFSFPQGHLKINANLCSDNIDEEIEDLKRWIDLYWAVGVKAGVIHPGGNKKLSKEMLLARRVNGLKRLIEYIGDRDFTLCLENLFEIRDNQILPQVSTYEEMEEILNAVNSPRLGVCLDTGHYHLFHRDPDVFIKKMGKHLKALHIADNEGYSDQHLMPYGRGTIDWVKVMKALKEINYDGMFNLEIPGESRCPLAVQEYKLDYLRKLIDYLLEM